MRGTRLSGQIFPSQRERDGKAFERRGDITGEPGVAASLSVYDIASLAGIARARLFETLPLQSTPEKPLHETEDPGRALKHDTVFYHRSSLAAIQNIERGAVWSNTTNQSVYGRRIVKAGKKDLF